MNRIFCFRPTSISAVLRLGASALALFGVVASPSQAQQPQLPAVQVSQPDASSLRLRINNPAQERARLMVLSLSDNSTLLNETHREPAYGTRLQFSTLPSGRYAVLVRVGPARYRYTIQVDTQARRGTAIAVRETVTHRVDVGLPTAAL